MPILAINGINLGGIIAVGSAPTEPRREIGDVATANDGSLVPTRLAVKRDVTFTSVPLAGTDAFSWEQLIRGESEVFPFEDPFQLYSTKGQPAVPDAPLDTSIQSTTKKYGAAALKIAAAGQVVQATGYPVSVFTFSVWWNQNLAGWHHLVQRSDGAIWLDGIRNDAAATPFGLGLGDEPMLTAATNNDYFDDWVISPFLWLDDWAAQVYAAGAAFGQAPYLTATGLLISEAASRKMLGQASGASVFKGTPAGAGGQQSDLRTLAVTLQGV